MKKMIGMITLLLLMMGVVGCNGEKVNIDFPFEVGEVENFSKTSGNSLKYISYQ